MMNDRQGNSVPLNVVAVDDDDDDVELNCDKILYDRYTLNHLKPCESAADIFFLKFALQTPAVIY